MTGASPAHITVNVRQRPTAVTIELSAARKGVQTQRFRLDGRDRIERALEELDSGLLRLKDALPALTASDRECLTAYSVLREIGSNMLFALFGNNETVVHKLRDFWQAAFPFACNPQSPVPLVECIGDSGMTFPLEYLPLLRMPLLGAPSSRADVISRFSSFVGFSCIVQRKMRLPSPGAGLALQLNPDEALPMRYFYYDSLRGAREELRWLTSAMSSRIYLEGPFPSAEYGIDLPHQIYDPRLRADGSRRDMPDQIQHFGCHCYTKARSPLDSEIELSGGGRDVRLRLASIGSSLFTLAFESGRRNFDLPLVFLNACGSARMRADGAFSFPQLFLQNRNRGFIGTDIEMPDDVAAAFSAAFYERFLVWRLPLGRSMLEARRQLLHSSGNPLGIAYTSYADPDIHVSGR